jgi:hypothetical protein
LYGVHIRGCHGILKAFIYVLCGNNVHHGRCLLLLLLLLLGTAASAAAAAGFSGLTAESCCMLVAQQPVWPATFSCPGCGNASTHFNGPRHHLLLLLLLLCLRGCDNHQ